MKKIAIIGAGWVGVGVLRILKEKGYKVDVFEKRNDIGGVWHPDNAYAGLSIHQASKGIEFFDFPLPSQIDKTERIPSLEVYHYLQKYCQAKNLYPHMQFNLTVMRVNYDSQHKKSTIYYKNSENAEFSIDGYDYVIYTNGFSNHTVPHFPDANNFSGKIIHSFDANEKLMQSLIAENKKITVLGGSKTATDMIIYFYRCGYKVTWLYRTPYWFLRFDPFTQVIKDKIKGKKYRHPFYIAAVILGYLLQQISTQIAFLVWRACGVIHTFGNKQSNYSKFHFGYLDESQVDVLKKYSETHGISGEIKNFNKNTILLNDGRLIESDVVICCTGSGNDATTLIDISVDHEKVLIDKIMEVYRARVIPQVPNLIFTAYHFFTLGIANGLSYGNWIHEYIESNFTEKDLLQNADHYERPFFTHQLLFESDGSIFMKSIKIMDKFFKSGELSRKIFFKWYFFEYLFGVNGPKPLNFKKPRK